MRPSEALGLDQRVDEVDRDDEARDRAEGVIEDHGQPLRKIPSHALAAIGVGDCQQQPDNAGREKNRIEHEVFSWIRIAEAAV
jgi:hypothetical protein